jgi:shikimate kinase
MKGAHVILVGLPGAGKTAVSAEVGRRLGRPVVDLDRVIETRTGRTVAELFATKGEEHYRHLEWEATVALVDAEPAVVSPGGGWITRAATVGLVVPPAKLVYLKVTAEEALRRIQADSTISARPLLQGADPLASLRALERARAAMYERADHVVDTDVLAFQQVVQSVVELVSSPEAG